LNKLSRILGFLAIFLVLASWAGYQYGKNLDQIAESKLYWNESIKLAKNQSLTVEKFISIFGSRAKISRRKSDTVILREIIHLNSIVCDEWVFVIRYSWPVGSTAPEGSFKYGRICN